MSGWDSCCLILLWYYSLLGLFCLRLFPFKQKTIELHIEGEAKKDWRSILVYITFAVTVLLWMSDKFTGVNSNVVAMIPVAVFCVTGIITKRDLEESVRVCFGWWQEVLH